jgi:hypothetical protein
MGDALRRLFLSVAVALGLASGQPDPSILARVGLDGGALVVSAHVKDAFAPSAAELVETGTAVALRFSARLDKPDGGSYEATETRSIRYDQRTGRYDVAFARGKAASLVDPAAAKGLAAELARLELCPAAEQPLALRPECRIVVRASIGILDSGGAWHDAPVLWNYTEPRAAFALSEGGGGGP